MKIKKFSIQNFRGIKSLEVELTVPGTERLLDLVVFAGPNGCGKTSILEACLKALGRNDLIPQSSVSKKNVRQGSEGYIMGLTVEESGQTRTIQLNSLPDNLNDATNIFKYDQVAYFSSWRWPKLVGPVTITAGKPGKRPAKTEDNRLWRIKNYFVNLKARKAFMDTAESAMSSSPQEEAAWDRLNAAWQNFYPNSQDRFEALVASGKVEEGFELFFRRNHLEITIPVESLSSGEIEVLTFIGSFIIEDFSSGIVFIDEPELHLHPAWHRAMMRAIRSLIPDAQIICATHSAEVLDSVAAYERFILLDDQDPRFRLVTSSNQQRPQP